VQTPRLGKIETLGAGLQTPSRLGSPAFMPMKNANDAPPYIGALLAMLFATFFTTPVQSAIVYTGQTSGANDALPTNATAGTLTIPKPAGTVAGQALIASIAARPRNLTVNVPAGWIQMTITNQTNGGVSTLPGGMTLLTYYHIVGTTEPASYNWTFANTAGSGSSYGGSAVGGILAFSGIDTSSGSPINVWSQKLTASGLTHSTTSITPTVTNTMIVSSISYLSGGSFGNPSGITGITERLDQRAPATANAIGTTLQMSTAPWSTATATGSSQATASGDADTGIGHLMILEASTIDLAITMALNTALVAGGTGSYTLTVVNNGINAEPGPITVINTLPTGLTYNPAGSGGTGWACSAAGQLVTCTRAGALSAGGSAAPLLLNVNVSSTVSGTITNTAKVSGEGGDGNTANNTAVDTFSTNSVAANFNCVAVGAASNTGHLDTQLVNTAFNVDVVALKSDGTEETSYATTGSKNVTLEWVDGTCSTLSPTILQTVNITAANAGRKTVSSIINKAYRNLRCRVTDANQSPSVVGCSTDNFSVRPSNFTVTSNANADAAGISNSATPVLKSGAGFSLTAASNVAGYDNAPSLDTNKISAHTGSARAGTLTGGFGIANPATGEATGSAFKYSEVGYFNFAVNGVYDDIFTAVDSAVGDCTADFSNTTVGGKVGCKFGNTAATNYFGRFIPDHFDVTVKSNGTMSAACSSGSFTYTGQSMGYGSTPSLTIKPMNTVIGGSVTQNYSSAFQKLTASGVTITAPTEDGTQNGKDGLTKTKLTASMSSGTLTNSSGTLTYTLATGDQYTFTRDAKALIDAYTSNIRLAVTSVTDGEVSAAGVLPTLSPNGVSLRYGRLALQNAHGSELLELPVSLTAQYWNGSAFVLNTSDSCTTVSAPASGSGLTFYSPEAASGVQGNHLSAAETFATVSATNKLVAGDAQLKFSAPGGGNDGYLDMSIVAPNWLKFDWNAANAGDESPSGRATFGIYKGNDSQIYLREVY